MTEKYSWILAKEDDENDLFWDKADSLTLEELREAIFVMIQFDRLASTSIIMKMRGNGKYCGRCDEKSRAYEGGKCGCDYQLEFYSDRMNRLKSIYFEKAEEESKVSHASRKEEVTKLLKLEKIE